MISCRSEVVQYYKQHVSLRQMLSGNNCLYHKTHRAAPAVLGGANSGPALPCPGFEFCPVITVVGLPGEDTVTTSRLKSHMLH